MTFKLITSTVPLLLWILNRSLHVVHADHTDSHPKCPCLYEEKDEGECLSFSKNAAGSELKGWPVASETCLKALDIEERVLDNLLFWQFCPYPNRTDVDYAELISFLQTSPTHAIAREVMELFVDRNLFVPSGDSFVLADEIVTGLQVPINCTVEQNFCWGQVRVEFEGRRKKINSLCANLHERQTAGWKLEQATARLRLCQAPEPSCEPLSTQVQTDMPFGGDCANFAAEIPQETLREVCQDLLDQASATSGATTLGVVSVVSWTVTMVTGLLVWAF